MAAGLQVFNDSNILQIDSTFSNLAYVNSFTVWVPQGNSIEMGVVNHVETTSPYMYAFRTEPGYDNRKVCMIVHPNKLAFVGNTDGPTVVRVYRFARDASSATGNYGLEVYKENGQLAFSSIRPYMRVLDFVNNYDPLGSTTGNFTKNFATKPAVLVGTMGQSGTFRRRGGGTLWYWLQRASSFSFSGNSVSFQSSGITSFLEGDDDYTHIDNYRCTANSALIIDATAL